MAAVISAFAMTLLTPRAGTAQVDVGFNIGFYTPIGSMVERGSKSNPAMFFQQRLQATLAVATSITYWTSKKIGFQASVGFTPSDVAQTDTTGTHDHKTSLVLAGARVLYAFTPMEMEKPRSQQTRWTESHWSFYVGAGVGVASRSGATWNYSTGLTSPALLLNVGVRTPLGGKTVLRFDVEDYLSRAQFDKGLVTQTDARTHNDLLITISFARRIRR